LETRTIGYKRRIRGCGCSNFQDEMAKNNLKTEGKNNILIVGAGPSGLALALFLSEKGVRPRIIEKNDMISQYSKALGVNPRTLELLEESGLANRFLEKGRQMRKINIWKMNEHIFQNDLSHINHKYPFMLILPQKESEQILLEALSDRNIKVEFGISFKSLDLEKNHPYVILRNSTGILESGEVDLLIGADGARSEVRKQCGIKLKGFQYEGEWELLDVELDSPLARDEGHVRLFREGGMIMIRLKDNIWRVAGNMKSMLNYLPKHCRIGEIVWKSNFRISHRVAGELVKNKVVIIGDAAHLHSPVGARGMNLGIEDAYIVSNLIAEGKTAEYTKIRKAYLNKTVKRINGMTQGLAGGSFLSRSLRTNINLFKFVFPLVMPTARKFIMGLHK
jgi:2-polyprenyl-6-methoxyphenol hydroxylase-like FAD-dependent oxidoreductase